MLYCEFIEGTGAPDNMVTHTIYAGLNRVYMRHDDYTKEEAYRDGARILEDLDEVAAVRRNVPKNAYYHGMDNPLTYECSHCHFHVDAEDVYCRQCGAEFLKGWGENGDVCKD